MAIRTRVRELLKHAISDLARTHRPRRGLRHRRAMIEQLEVRTLLTNYSVTNLNDAGTGSLRDAISQANANPGADEITFAASGTIALTTGEIAITDSLNLRGTSTTISGSSTSRIFLIGGAGATTVSLSNLTLRDGNGGGAVTTGFGGAIFLTDGFEGNDVLNLQNCTLTSNSAALGGAIYAVDSSLNIFSCALIDNFATGSGSTRGGGAIAANATVTMIQNSTISDNTATGTGGGIYNFTSDVAVGQRNSTLTVVNSTVGKNKAFNGGGIYNQNQNPGEAAVLSVIGSTFKGNYATDSGGALLTNSIASISSTVFTDNYALSGGAVYNYSGVVTLTNSTVSGNRAGAFGGGIWNLLSGSMLISGCTFVGNRADSDGDTYGVGGAISEFLAPVVSRNSIYAGNVRGAAGNEIPDDVTTDPASTTPAFMASASFNNLIGDPGLQSGLTHGQNGNILGNGLGLLRPLVAILNPALANNGGPTQTHTLAVGSPAIDAGTLIPDLLISPVSATSSVSGTDLLPAANLVNGLGLTLQSYSTTDDGTSGWVTNAPNGGGSDYFTNGSTSPALTFSLDNIYLLTDIAVWGFSDSAANDDARTLKVEFSLDGGTTFANSVTLTKPRYAAQMIVHTIPFGGAIAANAVRVTIVDNYFGEPGNSAGNRVGLDEVRFLQRGLTPPTDQRGAGFARRLDGDQIGGPAIDIGAVEAAGIQLIQPAVSTLNPRPTLQWTAVGGATAYNIWVDRISTTTTSQFYRAFNVAGLSHTVTKDFPIGKYRVWIQPVFGATTGLWSSPRDIFVVTAPTWQSTSPTQAVSRPTILWNALPGAVKYDVWVDRVLPAQSQVIRQDVVGTSFTPASDLTMGSYRAWVRGVDALGMFSAWSPVYNTNVVPTVIPIGTVTSTFDPTPTFAWNEVPGAARYEVTVRNSTTSSIIYNAQSTTATNWTPPTDLAVGPHSWSVVAVSSVVSGSLKSVAVTRNISIGGRPTIIAPVANSSSSVRMPAFSWSPVDGASSYELWIDRTDIAQSKIIYRTGLTTASFTATTALPAGSYRAWVRAVSSTGAFSLYSVDIRFTITAISPKTAAPAPEYQLTLLLSSDLTTEHAVEPSRSLVDAVKLTEQLPATENVEPTPKPLNLACSPDAGLNVAVDQFMMELALHEF